MRVCSLARVYDVPAASRLIIHVYACVCATIIILLRAMVPCEFFGFFFFISPQ